VIKKSFLRSPSAHLTEDGREIARFGEADKAVWDILGIGPGSGRSIDGAFGLLWVRQGTSFIPPVPGAGAASMLNAAIGSEVGALVGGERARCAVDAINAELWRSLTDSERGPRFASTPRPDYCWVVPPVLRTSASSARLVCRVACSAWAMAASSSP
jgi:hypothetical protein